MTRTSRGRQWIALIGFGVTLAFFGTLFGTQSKNRLVSPVVNAARLSPEVIVSSPPVLSSVEEVTSQTLDVVAQPIRVPILMYHYVHVVTDPSDQLGFRLTVTPADFQEQMTWLAAAGYHPLSLDEFTRALQGEGALPDKPILLTFDDGYSDFYMEAFPVLQELKFPAVQFVVSGFVGRPGYLTAEQIHVLARSNLVTIGAHTVYHTDLIKSSNPREEIAESKRMLEELIGQPVTSFAYPAGRYDQTTVATVQEVGFTTAFTTHPGARHTLAGRATLDRLRVNGGTTLAQFQQIVRGDQ